MIIPDMKLKDFNFKSIIKLLDVVDRPPITNTNINLCVSHGIKYGLAREYQGELSAKFNWDGKLNTFSREMAMFILEKHYWNKIGGDQLLSIHRLLADRMMDFAYNTDVETANRSLSTLCNSISSGGKYWPLIRVREEMDYELISTLQSIFRIRGNDAICVIIAMLFSMQIESIMKYNRYSPYTKDVFTACADIFTKQTWYASIVLAIG